MAQPGRLQNRVVLITGGGRGIGRAAACAFARAGARVIVAARTEVNLEATVAEIRAAGGQAEWRVVDLGYPKKAAALGQWVLRRHGVIDVLINNAAALGPKAFIVDYPFEQWEEVLRINLHSLFSLTQIVARSMLARKAGCIISLSSSVGRRGRAGWGGYAVSKAGLESLTQTLSDELRAYNVRVLALNPGATRTEMRALAYPDEVPQTLKRAEVVAGVLVDLAVREDMALSGRSFDAEQILKEGIRP